MWNTLNLFEAHPQTLSEMLNKQVQSNYVAKAIIVIFTTDTAVCGVNTFIFGASTVVFWENTGVFGGKYNHNLGKYSNTLGKYSSILKKKKRLLFCWIYGCIYDKYIFILGKEVVF